MFNNQRDNFKTVYRRNSVKTKTLNNRRFLKYTAIFYEQED